MSEYLIPSPPSGKTQWDIASSQKFCTELAEKHYENFPVGSRWIPAFLRSDVHTIYAFARLADDFADEAEYEGHRLERLALWRAFLQEAAKGSADHPIFIALADTISRHQIPIEWLDHLIQAFEWDVRKNRHENFKSILDYARYSANPVGRLVLWLHGYRDAELFRLSDYICTALQFANFWQDVAVDLQKNRIYLPQDDMRLFGITEHDLLAGTVDDRFRELMLLEVNRTWDLFRRGRPLCNRVGSDLRTELRLVWSGGTRILERIFENDFDVFRDRPTLRLRDKGVMLWRTVRWRSRPREIQATA